MFYNSVRDDWRRFRPDHLAEYITQHTQSQYGSNMTAALDWHDRDGPIADIASLAELKETANRGGLFVPTPPPYTHGTRGGALGNGAGMEIIIHPAHQGVCSKPTTFVIEPLPVSEQAITEAA